LRPRPPRLPSPAAIALTHVTSQSSAIGPSPEPSSTDDPRNEPSTTMGAKHKRSDLVPNQQLLEAEIDEHKRHPPQFGYTHIWLSIVRRLQEIQEKIVANCDALLEESQQSYNRLVTYTQRADSHIAELEAHLATAKDEVFQVKAQKAELHRQNEALVEVNKQVLDHAATEVQEVRDMYVRAIPGDAEYVRNRRFESLLTHAGLSLIRARSLTHQRGRSASGLKPRCLRQDTSYRVPSATQTAASAITEPHALLVLRVGALASSASASSARHTLWAHVNVETCTARTRTRKMDTRTHCQSLNLKGRRVFHRCSRFHGRHSPWCRSTARVSIG